MRLDDPGYTPARKEIAALLERLAVCSDDDVARIERLVLAHPDEAFRRAAELLPEARAPWRGRLADVLARVAAEHPHDERWRHIVKLLDDTDLKVRRNAVIALGRATTLRAEAEAAAIAYWAREPRVDHRRSVAATLGKIGGEPARALLATVVTDDTLLRREVDRALLRLARAVPSDDRLDPDATPAAPLALRYTCRAGLEEVLRDELPIAWSPRLGAPGTVLARAAASLTALHAPRCFAELAFELRSRRRQPDDDLAAHVAAMMTSPEATAILQAYTRGALRWRVVWTRGGHRRALVEAVERAVATRLPGSVNDPQRALWTLEVDDDPRGVRAVLVPWWKDTRFAYRVAEMPAASNPVVAATLARVAGVAPDNVVVDPFCGTSLELIERARLGAYRALHGRDLSAEAIAKARQNITAAGITDARVAQGDAFDRLPEGTTLVLTNPPLGYRVGFGAPTDRILVRFVEHAARSLVSGGRLVWLSSAPEATAEAGRRAGLRVSLRRAVDLAGMAVELQRMDKP